MQKNDLNCEAVFCSLLLDGVFWNVVAKPHHVVPSDGIHDRVKHMPCVSWMEVRL